MTKHLGIIALLLCTHIAICNQDAIKLQLRIGETDFSELTPDSYVSLIPANKDDIATKDFLANAKQVTISLKQTKTDYYTTALSVGTLIGILFSLTSDESRNLIRAGTVASLALSGFFIVQNVLQTDGQHWFKSINNNTTIHLKKQNNRWVIEYLKIS